MLKTAYGSENCIYESFLLSVFFIVLYSLVLLVAPEVPVKCFSVCNCALI